MARGRADQDGTTLQGASGEGERRPGLRAVAGAAGRVAAPIVARGGGGVFARLKAEWTAVAGNEFGPSAWPEALLRGGTLKLRVDPGFALDLQHRAPLLIDRINLFFGRAVVARLALVQGKLPLAAPPLRAAAAPLTHTEATALDARLAGIADPGLRSALAELGRLVIAGSRGGR
jgi:hypothetical protein